MSLPVLPSPQSITPAQLADFGAQVVAWAEQVDDIAQVKDAANKWAAITEYARRTSREGIAEAETALRRIEERVGHLIRAQRERGELAPAHRPSGSVITVTLPDLGISRQEAADFTLMAEHPEIVEQVIATSNDASPPSRRKVIAAIRDTKVKRDIDAELAEAREHAPNLRNALAALPDETRSYLVTIRIKSHPDFIERRLPIGFEVVAIEEESTAA